jgi:hypothetical protein
MLMVQKLFRILQHNFTNDLLIIIERMASFRFCDLTSTTFRKFFKFGCCLLCKPCSCYLSSWACVTTLLRAFRTAATTEVALGTEISFHRSQHLWTTTIHLFCFKHQIPNYCIQVIDLLLNVWKINCNVLTLSCNYLLKMVKHLSIAIVNWLNNEVLNLCHNRFHHARFNLTQENLLLNWILHIFWLALNTFQIRKFSLHFVYFSNYPG